jgi:transcriptional regulator with XRE-family HTH domain
MPGRLLQSLRSQAGLSQAQLARRLGTTQPAIARLESASSNPTVETLARAVSALGGRLRLEVDDVPPAVDESLIRQHLELTPAQRIAQLEAMDREARAIARAGAKARGELD